MPKKNIPPAGFTSRQAIVSLRGKMIYLGKHKSAESREKYNPLIAEYGLEHAQAVLGHSSAKTTEIYARVNFDKAAAVMEEIG